MNKFAEQVRKFWVLGLGLFSYHTAERYLKHSESPDCRKRADHVRKVARVFHTDNFPEIFSELELCPQCKQLTLLLVHPNMKCDSCWLAEMRLVQEYIREGAQSLKEGVPLKDVRTSTNEKLANDPRTC